MIRLASIPKHYNPVPNIAHFNKIAAQLNSKDSDQQAITIGIVGKYTGLTDSYLSLTKALLSASLQSEIKLQIIWIESSHLEMDENTVYSSSSNENSKSTTPKSKSRSPSIEEMKDMVHNISIFSDSFALIRTRVR